MEFWNKSFESPPNFRESSSPYFICTVCLKLLWHSVWIRWCDLIYHVHLLLLLISLLLLLYFCSCSYSAWIFLWSLCAAPHPSVSSAVSHLLLLISSPMCSVTRFTCTIVDSKRWEDSSSLKIGRKNPVTSGQWNLAGGIHLAHQKPSPPAIKKGKNTRKYYVLTFYETPM